MYTRRANFAWLFAMMLFCITGDAKFTYTPLLFPMHNIEAEHRTICLAGRKRYHRSQAPTVNSCHVRPT